MKNKVYAVILVGGKGARLWPLSKKGLSKAFVSIAGKGTLVVQTVGRLNGLVGKGATLFVVDKTQSKALRRAVKGIPPKNIIVEPFGRSTASAVGLAAIKADPDDVLIVLPSDAYFENTKLFQAGIRKAVKFVESNGEAVVCLGIAPAGPVTGYGYIKMGKACLPGLYKAAGFTEKPGSAKARMFVRSKRYLWNAGIFIFKAGSILSLFQKHAGSLYKELLRIQKDPGCAASAYGRMDNISIDYQLIEKLNDLYCVRLDTAWQDLGTWESVDKMFRKDSSGNHAFGRARLIDTRNSFIYNAEDRMLGVIGMDDAVVVHTANGTLVCKKESAERVKELGIL